MSADRTPIVLSEADCEALVSPQDAFEAVRDVFAAMAAGKATNFPVVREAIGHADALYGFKSGFDAQGLALGVKSGGYWPNNAQRGLTNHQSTVFLFDADTGRLAAVVGGNYLTAVRTAAACAVSVDALARKDAKVLGMVGAGHQSAFQLRAVAACRPFEKVVAWNRSPEALERLEGVARDLSLPFEAVSLEALGESADVIVTITSSHAPILTKEMVRAGTHIAAMGTDTKGKQELGPDLVAAASVFTDEPAQSATLGEAQHAVASGALGEDEIVAIGRVFNGDHGGRASDEEITLFDGTGVGLQDLAVAAAAESRARERGMGTLLSL